MRLPYIDRLARIAEYQDIAGTVQLLIDNPEDRQLLDQGIRSLDSMEAEIRQQMETDEVSGRIHAMSEMVGSLRAELDKLQGRPPYQRRGISAAIVYSMPIDAFCEDCDARLAQTLEKKGLNDRQIQDILDRPEILAISMIGKLKEKYAPWLG